MQGPMRAWIFLAVISVLFMLLGHSLAGREGLLWALVFSLSINSLVYLYFDKRIISGFPGQVVEGRDPWGIVLMTKDLASRAKIPNPQIIITPNNSPQSLSVGRNLRKSYIVLTDGLLNKLSQEELRAVIAYNIATIKLQETTGYLIASTFCAAILFVTQFLDGVLRWLIGLKKESHSPYSHLFTYIFGPICYLVLFLCVRQNRYFSIDELAAKLLKNPQIMAQTLWKLQSYSLTLPTNAPASYAHAFIVNPLTNKGWNRYFQAQPTVEKRIYNLIGYYPI